MMDKQKIEKVIENLRANGFQAEYFAYGQAAVDHLLNEITPGMSIGLPGSMTVSSLGVAARAEAKGATVLEHGRPDLSAEQKEEIQRAQGRCDMLVVSTNALTEDGYLVNCDGRGNRVAAMIYGPGRVVVVAGINKICADIEAAMERIETVAAPKNAKRLGLDNPCTITGTCADCDAPMRICRAYTIMKRPMFGQNFTVLLVGEELGF